jgi:glycosyltransferase involved in cell wall biosynthesis
MPCYNAAKYLDDAIDSLRAQTYGDFELLAVDDGSKDETLARLEQNAARDPRIRFFSQKNAGPSAARNIALRHVMGEYVCFLDADDVLLPQKLERQIRFLQQHPQVDLVYSDYYTGDANLDLTALTAIRFPQIDMLEAVALRNAFPPLVPLFRRRLMDAVGEFDEAFRMTEDWDYWIRCAKLGTFAYLPGAMVIYRTHGAQAHHDLDKMFRAGKKVLRKHFKSEPATYHRALASWYARHAKARWAVERHFETAKFLAFAAFHNRLASLAARFSRPDRLAKPLEVKLERPVRAKTDVERQSANF